MVETEAGAQVAVRVPAVAFQVDAPHELLQPPPVCGGGGAGRAINICQRMAVGNSIINHVTFCHGSTRAHMCVMGAHAHTCVAVALRVEVQS